MIQLQSTGVMPKVRDASIDHLASPMPSASCFFQRYQISLMSQMLPPMSKVAQRRVARKVSVVCQSAVGWVSAQKARPPRLMRAAGRRILSGTRPVRASIQAVRPRAPQVTRPTANPAGSAARLARVGAVNRVYPATQLAPAELLGRVIQMMKFWVEPPLA